MIARMIAKMIVKVMVEVEMQVKYKKPCLLNSNIKARQKTLLYNKADTLCQ